MILFRANHPLPPVFFAGFVVPVHQDDGALHRDHSLLNHPFQVRQKQLDFLLGIHNLNQHRQVR
jgi:hypothetical protein